MRRTLLFGLTMAAILCVTIYDYWPTHLDPDFVVHGQTGLNPTPAPYVQPFVSQMVPTTANVGSNDFTIILTGSGFVSASVVYVNNVPVSTTVLSPIRISAIIPAIFFRTAGALRVYVYTPPPGGGTSGQMILTVLPALPVITGMLPSSGAPGTTFVARIIGMNLLGASSLAFSGAGVTAGILPDITPFSVSVVVTVANNASLGGRTVSITTTGGPSAFPDRFTVRAVTDGRSVSQPQRIPEIEEGSTKTGFVVITVEEGRQGPPLATLTLGMVQNGSVVSQATVLPSLASTSASIPVNQAPQIGRSFGISIVNPGPQDNQLSLALLDENGTPLASATNIVLQRDTQIARFVSEIFPPSVLGPSVTGSLFIQGTSPFSVTGFRFSGANFGAVPVTTFPGPPGIVDTRLTGINNPFGGVTGANVLVFPQFTIGGGWTSEIMLVDNLGQTTSGRIALFDSNGQPMTVKMNGQTSTTFRYSIPPGGAFVLAPRDANGQTVF